VQVPVLQLDAALARVQATPQPPQCVVVLSDCSHHHEHSERGHDRREPRRSEPPAAEDDEEPDGPETGELAQLVPQELARHGRRGVACLQQEPEADQREDDREQCSRGAARVALGRAPLQHLEVLGQGDLPRSPQCSAALFHHS
jgi:hypothetical protein